MSPVEIFSIISSAFSTLLALFSIWVAYHQQRESQRSYEQTKAVLDQIMMVSQRIEPLVADNFQKMLGEVLKQNKTVEQKVTDFVFDSFDQDPEKTKQIVEIIKEYGNKELKNNE